MYIGGKYINNENQAELPDKNESLGDLGFSEGIEGPKQTPQTLPDSHSSLMGDLSAVSQDNSNGHESNGKIVDDDESSMSEFDELGDSSATGNDLRSMAAKETKRSLAKKENRFVICLRYFVLSVLLGTAIGVSISTYLYAKGVEQDSFRAEFSSVAVVTLRSFVEAVEHSFGSLDAVASGITSHAQRTGEVFPNVTVPDFEIKGSTARTQTGSIFMFWLPLVTDETRAGYEEYTKQMQGQLFGSYIAEEGLRIYQDAYFGINASETEAAEARAQAEAEARAEAEAEAAAFAAEQGTAPQERQPTDSDMAEEAQNLHSHGDGEEEHTHRQLRRQLRQNDRPKPKSLSQKASPSVAAVTLQQKAAQRQGEEETSTDEERERQQMLDYMHSRVREQAEAYQFVANRGAGQNQKRDLHVAPPDTGLPPFGHPVIHEQIWGLNSLNFSYNPSWWEPQNTGPYLPTWQMSPTIPLPALINFNFYDYLDLAPALNQSVNTGKAVLSLLQTNHQGEDTEQLIQIFLTLNQYRHRVVDYNADPMTQVMYPVFDSFHPTTKNVSGVLLSAIFWRLLLLDILPENVQGVIAVLSNSLNQSVTYQINGRDVEYIGLGDLHEEKYNHMGQSRDISEYIKQRASVESDAYTTVELDSGYSSYTIHVYPSQTMENTYITNDPILYAIIVAFIFVFTSAVFILYDFCVAKRQKKVMQAAVRSTAVVSSLFPKSVQDRLFAQTKDESTHEPDPWTRQNSEQGGAVGGIRRRMSFRQSKSDIEEPVPDLADYEAELKAFGDDDKKKDGNNQSYGHMMSNSSSFNDNRSGHFTNRSAGSSHHFDRSNRGERRKKKKGKVIADKYEATTVFFADLAGFTKWSSSREPEQVFELLEALYGSFDKVAIRRAVFKVETIGDCYMAVTGLPNPQPDHAIRAVKFARDCMMRMDRILHELQHTLGADTLELGFRVGLHSGPVTAGVLRGDKGRFQLFGDTVNTASRMESNGVKGRIHCSQSTADLLPTKWLTAREDKIVAKGKGEMQTYYVDSFHEARSAASGFSALSHITPYTPTDDEPSLPKPGNIEIPQTCSGDQQSIQTGMSSMGELSADSFVQGSQDLQGIDGILDDVSALDNCDIKDVDFHLSFKNDDNKQEAVEQRFSFQNENGDEIEVGSEVESFENEAPDTPNNSKEKTGKVSVESFKNEAPDTPNIGKEKTGKVSVPKSSSDNRSDDESGNRTNPSAPPRLPFGDDGDESFENEIASKETAPNQQVVITGRFSRFGDSIAKALKLADEISV